MPYPQHRIYFHAELITPKAITGLLVCRLGLGDENKVQLKKFCKKHTFETPTGGFHV